MKLLVFGATGETGRELVKQSLKLGHFVTVLVRDLQKMDIRYVVPGGGAKTGNSDENQADPLLCICVSECFVIVA